MRSASVSNAGYELAFYGGSFTAGPVSRQEELLGAALPFLRSGVLNGVRISTRPDAVDIETAERLGCFGVKTIEIGAQSMIDHVLAASGRGHVAGDTAAAARIVKDRGFDLILQMMTGLPGSSEELDFETARRVIDLGPAGVRIYPTVVFENTVLHEMQKSGTYKEHTLDAAVRVCAKIVPEFEKAGIKVIRTGINTLDDMALRRVAAGAYHPAFGELVRSRIMLRKAEEMLSGTACGSEIALGVSRFRISAMTGQNRENLKILSEEFSLKSIKVMPADVENDEILLL